MATMNRGTLKKAAMKGELFVRCQHHMTDDYAGDNANRFGRMDEFLPARFIAQSDRSAPFHVEGFITLHESDFGYKSGCAYKNEDGRMFLHVHSNLCYEIQIRKAA